MRLMILTAVLANDEVIQRQGVMCTALVATAARMFSLWQRAHVRSPTQKTLVQASIWPKCVEHYKGQTK
jgi:hypothetical protein